MVFLDEAGQTVYGKLIDSETSEELPFTSLNDYIIQHQAALAATSPELPKVGLIALPDGSAILASRQILQSDGSGPSRGSLLFGKYLSPAFMADLQDVTHLSIELLPLDSPDLPDPASTVGMALYNGEIQIQIQSDDAILGYTVLKDIYGEPVLALRVNSDRPIFAYGQYVFKRASAFILLFIALIEILTLLVLEKFILSRLSKMNTEIKSIEGFDRKNKFITVSKEDEIGEVALAVNSMLTNIYEAQGLREKYIKSVENAKIEIEKQVAERTEELNAERARFLASVNSLKVGFAIIDNKGKLLLQNPALSRLLSLELPPATLTAVSKMLKQEIDLKARLDECAVKKCTVDDRQIAVNDKIFELHITPVFASGSGVSLGGILLLEDVTDERLMDRAKTEFVSLSSHQLRTPLTAINWYIEMLQGEDLGKMNKEQSDCMAEISLGNHRMVNLVNSLIEASRLELGNVVFAKVPTDLSAMVKDITKQHKDKISEQKITVTTKFGKLCHLAADDKYLRLALDHVVMNALKYTPEGGKVKISTETVLADQKFGGRLMPASGVGLTVSDTGYGIPGMQQTKIFQKLFRADNVLDKDEEGTGLGLYITKSVVELSGGMIWFESEENVGSVFYVFLPCGPGVATPER